MVFDRFAVSVQERGVPVPQGLMAFSYTERQTDETLRPHRVCRFQNEMTMFPNPELVPLEVTLLFGGVVRRYGVEVPLQLSVPGTGGLS